MVRRPAWWGLALVAVLAIVLAQSHRGSKPPPPVPRTLTISFGVTAGVRDGIRLDASIWADGETLYAKAMVMNRRPAALQALPGRCGMLADAVLVVPADAAQRPVAMHPAPCHGSSDTVKLEPFEPHFEIWELPGAAAASRATVRIELPPWLGGNVAAVPVGMLARMPRLSSG